MKRIIAVLIGITVFFAFAAFAQAPAAPKAEPKAKIMHMTVTCKVTELTAADLKIERMVKDKAETMEFILEKATTNIAVGDEVKVTYHVKDGKNVAVSVNKAPQKKGETPKTAPVVKKDEPTTPPVTPQKENMQAPKK